MAWREGEEGTGGNGRDLATLINFDDIMQIEKRRGMCAYGVG